MRTELVSIPTPTAPLAGLYYEPDGGATAGAVLYFHGNTMNFYVCAARFLPPALTRLGFAFLAFNRRGHDILSTRNSRLVEGGAFQTTGEAIEDNRMAAEWLSQRGFPRPVVIGHSNGGMLGVRHVADHPETPALVLLSAGRGGTRQDQSGGTERLFAADRFDELKARAEELVRAGRGKELMFMPGWWYVISAESFLDRITTVPDTIALAPKVKCPVLAIRGDKEDVDRYPAEEFQRAAGGPCQVEVVPNCDHFYNGREYAIAEIVSSWLARTLELRLAV
ncbi:MAG: alpha/beta hydrolase [Betaproteobacteria bacterium]|nr:alpha/beta hydrolase [Gammaproteobacteria bacterium]MDH3436619.1 alpha/beta hydrolase [Betaproteobacteria bacterium]